MKKLLLVLMVVAMASFLLVGCLPGIGGEIEEEEEEEVVVEQAVTITVAGQAIVGDKTYVKTGALDVTVKFAEAIPADEAVWIINTTTTGWASTTATDATRTEFKGSLIFDAGDSLCTPVCIQVLVGDVCCADVIASQVVVVDGELPYATVVLDVDTCSCTKEAKFTFSGTYKTTCGYEGCCDDSCSGFDAWTIKIWPTGADKDCDDPCFEDTGACPVSSSTGCLDCLLFSDTTASNVFYDVDWTLVDKVGNKDFGTWVVELDTDSVVSITPTPAIDDAGNFILLDPTCPTE